MSKYKILGLAIGLCLPLISLAQASNFQKALKNGKNANLLYVANFKKFKIKDEHKLKKWCKENNFLIDDIAKKSKEVFGGHKEFYITQVTFRNKEDQAFWNLRYKANIVDASLDFLKKYTNSEHAERVFERMLLSVKDMHGYKTLYESFPAYKEKIILSAFESVKRKGNTKSYEDFIAHFPNTIYHQQALTNICNTLNSLNEIIDYTNKYQDLYDCLEEKAFQLTKNKQAPEVYSQYLLAFKQEEHKNEITQLLINKLKTISQCVKYYNRHKDLQDAIDDKAIKIALDRDDNTKKIYVLLLPNGKKNTEFKNSIQN